MQSNLDLPTARIGSAARPTTARFCVRQEHMHLVLLGDAPDPDVQNGEESTLKPLPVARESPRTTRPATPFVSCHCVAFAVLSRERLATAPYSAELAQRLKLSAEGVHVVQGREIKDESKDPGLRRIVFVLETSSHQSALELVALLAAAADSPVALSSELGLHIEKVVVQPIAAPSTLLRRAVHIEEAQLRQSYDSSLSSKEPCRPSEGTSSKSKDSTRCSQALPTNESKTRDPWATTPSCSETLCSSPIWQELGMEQKQPRKHVASQALATATAPSRAPAPAPARALAPLPRYPSQAIAPGLRLALPALVPGTGAAEPPAPPPVIEAQPTHDGSAVVSSWQSAERVTPWATESPRTPPKRVLPPQGSLDITYFRIPSAALAPWESSDMMPSVLPSLNPEWQDSRMKSALQAWEQAHRELLTRVGAWDETDNGSDRISSHSLLNAPEEVRSERRQELAREMLADASTYELDDDAMILAPLKMRGNPSGSAAQGLRRTSEEAKAKGLRGRALDAAQETLNNIEYEIRQGVREREGRLKAFSTCRALRRLVALLWEAVTEEVDALCISRRRFLDLHLSLARAGYFAKPHAATQRPYCYLPRPYVRYYHEHLSQSGARRSQSATGLVAKAKESAAEEAVDETDDEEEDYGEAGAGEGFRPFEDACAVWRQLHRHGKLQEPTLTPFSRTASSAPARRRANEATMPFDAFMEIVFELLDGEVRRTKPRSSERESALDGKVRYLQLDDYANATRQLLQRVVVEAPINEPNSPRKLGSEPLFEEGRDTAPVWTRATRAALASKDAEQIPRSASLPMIRRRGSMPSLAQVRASAPAPPPPPQASESLPLQRPPLQSISSESPLALPMAPMGGRRLSLPSKAVLAVMQARAQAAEAQTPKRWFCLQHKWGLPFEHATENRRKLGMLRGAIQERHAPEASAGSSSNTNLHGKAMRAAALKEFGIYSDGDDRLSYTNLFESFKAMPGAYGDLCFPYNLIARPTGQLDIGPGQAKLNAERAEVEHMLAFMRILDEDDGGYVTAESFGKALATQER